MTNQRDPDRCNSDISLSIFFSIIFPDKCDLGMEPNGVGAGAVPYTPSAGDLILQQRTEALQSQKNDGTLLAQLTSNPLFTAVCNPALVSPILFAVLTTCYY